MPNPYLLEFTNGQNAHKNSSSQVNLNNGKMPSASFGNRSKQTNSNIVLPTNQNIVGGEPKNRKKSESIDVGKNNLSKPNQNQHMQYTNYSSNNSTHIQTGTQKQIRQNMKTSLRNSHNKSIGAVPESMILQQQESDKLLEGIDQAITDHHSASRPKRTNNQGTGSADLLQRNMINHHNPRNVNHTIEQSHEAHQDDTLSFGMGQL